MATTTLKGIVKHVLPIETYGDGAGRKQTIVVFIPGYVDQWTGEKKGADEEWGIDLFNKNIDEYKLGRDAVDRKVEAEVYLKGRSYDRADGKKGYSIGATLKSIRLLEHAGTNFDDIPF